MAPRGDGGSGIRFGDRGATATEYLGMLVVAVAVLAAVSATGVGQALGERIGCVVAGIGGGGGGCGSEGGDRAAPRTDAEYEPTMCNTHNFSDKAGARGRFMWIEWGEEYGFRQQTHRANTDVNEDGRVDGDDRLVYMTFTDAASVGAKGSVRTGLKVGKLGTEDVSLGAGLKVTNGDTWVFRSEEEAQSFRDDIEMLKTYELTNRHAGEASAGNAILAIFGKGPIAEEQRLRERLEERIGDRHISYGTIGLNGTAAAGLKLSAGDDRKLSARLGGNVEFAPEATVANDRFRGTRSYTYTARLTYGGGTGYEAGFLKGDHHGETARTGSMTVVRDDGTGELLRIVMTQTIETGGGGHRGEAGGSNGEEGGGKRGGSASVTDDSGASGIEVVTNMVSFPPGAEGEAARETAQRWLDGNGDNTAPFAYMFGDRAPTTRPGSDDPFGQLMFDEGMSSRMSYEGETEAAAYGFEVNLGMSLGFSVSTEQKEETLGDARFLGAPRDGRREYVPYSYCAN
ncbi:hypothetical protein [Streptomyces sp. KL2]|uniref:hypothetical protein n=1 Tax=Streptomyces sp. KL2 TaxID=3050126 RepID=UPI00397B5644